MKSSVLLASFLLASSAAAQSPAILGRDDAAFARELYRRGWPDLAEGVVHAYELLDKEGKAEGSVLLEMQAIGLDLQLDAARREPDLVQRQQAIAAVIAAKEKLVEEHPRSDVGRETRDNLPDAYRMLGEALTAALANETDGARIAQARQDGEAAFTRAEDGLKERIERYKELRFEEGQTAADTSYMNALFNLGRTHYFHARFYPAEDPKRAELLEDAIRVFSDFGLDYSDRLLNFDAIYYTGLCHKAVGAVEDALVDWADVVALREGFEQDDEGRYLVIPDVADLIAKSVLQQVLLLTELDRPAEAVAAADDYLRSIPDAESAATGPAVLAAKADAQIAAEDSAGAGETARRLIEIDGSGPWGNKGREILARLIGGAGGATVDPAEILRVAQSQLGQRRIKPALEAIQRALQAARGHAKEQDIGSQALYLMGQAYRQKGWYHEAAAAFDAAYDLYPQGDAAPDALAAGIDAYTKLNAQERRPFYKTRVQERGQTLTRQFATHSAAATVQFSDAKFLRDEGKFLEAARMFGAVRPGAQGFEEAQVQAGNCLYLHGSQLARQGKADEAKTTLADAEKRLKQALADLAVAKTKTLDQEVLARLASNEYMALATLAALYLEDSIGRPADVLTLLEGADERFASDPRSIESLWTLRIRALDKQGKLDDAMAQFDSLLVRQSDRAGLAGAAGVLARSLDQRALDLSADAAKQAEAQALWRKAAGYYVLSVQSGVDDTVGGSSANLEAVGKRLLELGMLFNGVPEDSNSFVGWKPTKPVDTELWELAAKLFASTLELDPASYRARIGQGRALGFLGRWPDAAKSYAALFDQERLVKKDEKGFEPQVVQNKPELLEAYLEWGVCESETGAAEKAPDSQTRASKIFELMVNNTTVGGRLWWAAKYGQSKTFYDRGLYDQADVSMRNLERATTKEFQGAPESLKALLVALRTDIGKKVIRK